MRRPLVFFFSSTLKKVMDIGNFAPFVSFSHAIEIVKFLEIHNL